MKTLFTALLTVVSALSIYSAKAQDSAAAAKVSEAPELFSAGYLAQVVGSLLLVFVCLFGVVYLLKRFNHVGGGTGSVLRVIGSTSVGQREKVVLLEVGNEQLLIGVAAGSVRTLHVLEERVTNDKSAGKQTADFAAVLRAANPLGGGS